MTKFSRLLTGAAGLVLLGACAHTQPHSHDHPHEPVLVHEIFSPGVSPVPDRIILNLTEDASTSMAVNWRTDTSVTGSVVQYALATHGPEFKEDVHEVRAYTEALSVQYQDEPQIDAHYHSAILTGLTPNTKYVYRVGDGVNWSEWFQFDTAGEQGEPFSFIYFGDAQNNIKSMWSRVIREAYATMPRVDFMLHAGDLINRHDRDLEWGEWFYAGGFIHGQVPSVMTPGNHEYGSGMELSPQWRPGFNLPKNGPVGVANLSETVYYVDYQDMRLISLDADMITDVEESAAIQAAWLDRVLSENDRKWTAVFLHKPFFSTRPGRVNPELLEIFKPIIEQHRVDIVLQGHDHGYARGMVYNIPEGVSTQEATSGTVYVVSVSGPKMYPVGDLDWSDRSATGTQLFQLIRVDGDTLSYEAYTATGALYDAFDLTKSDTGPNLLENRIPADVPERWIPDFEQPSVHRSE